ncbi:SusD/RagB family nutrient-binding outer membrane lipoprotein [Sediminibacterium roseum]|uniref:SusD/RagB family nutrient-binding outer membrane lipoprotein n=1 Tax=Sediminibacterium roseum TaxID=1978412 RepID=A0ABW9ZYX4_9BACT|nr:SusD/RagB family nutrient-binding outer membrane lipoprotein [Sediminibacterium roseum]NCI51517.1 SusD/RagB family nutrient-binding outer membrane lipoprotein [Sediminibacterium roseum]
MKKFLKLGSIATAIAATALMGTGCSKLEDFGTTNVNPGGTTTPVTAALLTNVESGMGAGYGVGIQPGYYAQYFAETQYPALSLYGAPIVSLPSYSSTLYDLQNIINLNSDPATKAVVATSGGNANQIGIARILKAYIFWTITDRWGDIPYSEALKGSGLPKYDKQQDIYVDLVKELKEGALQLDDASAPFKGDIIMNYAGTGTAAATNAKWRKFANSVRLLIALRTSKVYPTAGQWAATEFNAALTATGGLMTENTDNVIQTYPNTTFANPWYTTYVAAGARFDNAVSKTLTDTLSAYNDPRLGSYASTPNGMPYGLNQAAAQAVYDATTTAFPFKGKNSLATDPITILNSAMITFARAEAAERGWTTESALLMYNKGVTLSLTQYGATTGQVATYLAQPVVAYGTDNLHKIGVQRWLATYPNGIDAWAEYRRTGWPALKPAVNATNTSKQIPRRYQYNTEEYNLNGKNLSAAISLLSGGDSQDSRIWWDK